jgi:GNAT superfamily N-acetyltransferase
MTNALAYKLQRLSATYRREGPKATAVQVLTWVTRRLYRREDHLILSRPPAEDLPFAVEAGLEVRSLGESDVEAVLKLTRDDARPFLKSRYPAFIALLDGEPIGCLWWVDRTIDPDHPDLVLHHIELEDAEAYAFYLLVREEYRGGGVSTEFMSRVLLELRELGYKNLQGFVVASNTPARWLFSLVGFKVTRTITIRRLFSLVALADRRLLIRNIGFKRRHAFGDRLLLSLGR